MPDRPAILAAKLERLLAVIEDADRLKAMPQAERPKGVGRDAVRDAYADAVHEVRGSGGSVASIESVPTPTERLEDT